MDKTDDTSLYYLEKAPVPKAIVHMVVPLMLGMAVNLIYNMTDAFYIGMLDSTPMMAALTLVLPFLLLLMAASNLLGVGGSTYISRLLGEKNHSSVKKASAVTFYLSILTGFIFIGVCLPLLSPILSVLGASGETLVYTRAYLSVLIIGSPLFISSFVLEQMVRSEGASKESMMGMVLSVVANMILDPLLIFGFGMGITGAAIATVAGNVFAIAYYLRYLNKKSSVQSVSFKDFKPSVPILFNIFKIGISAFLLDGFMILSSLLLNNYAVLYGDSVVAAFGISQRIVQIADLVAMGFFMGVVPLIAYAYAAQNTKRLNEIINTAFVSLIILTGGIAAILFVFRSLVIGLFSNDADVLSVGTYILSAMLVSTIFAGCSGMFTGIFQAFGKGLQSTVMSIARGLVFIPILIAGHYLFQLHGVIWSLTAAEIIACAVGFVLWFSLKNRLKFKKELPAAAI